MQIGKEDVNISVFTDNKIVCLSARPGGAAGGVGVGRVGGLGVGELALGGLGPGKWRPLRLEELALLQV